jgi:glutaredoxin 3
MKPVTIYTTPYCPFCVRAKKLLTQKNVAYEEIDVSTDDDARDKLMQRTGQQTVPQIYIGEQHVGGSDDLYELEHSGQLDALLQ